MDIPVSVTIKRTAFGVGFTLRDEGKPYESTAIVSRVARGSPAEASGLKAGDQIIAINQKPVKSMTFLEVSNFLRSGSDQSIELTLVHKAQSHKECNGAIMSCNELPESNALISSSMANSIERISIKDTNIPSECGTTDGEYGGGGGGDVAVEQVKVTSDSASTVSTTTAHKTEDNDHQSDRPKPKPRNTNRKYHDYSNNNNNYNDMENVETLRNKSSMKPVLSQLQEPKSHEYNHSSTVPLLSNNCLPSEGRKENTIPPSSLQFIHNPPGKNDDDKHATVKSASCNHHNPSTTTAATTITNSTKTNKEGVRIIRKHTIDSSVLLEETNADTLPVRFIRKRAYASARHPGRYDQVNLLTPQNNATPTSPPHPPPTTTATTINHSEDMPSTIIPPSSLSNTLNTSPCQLLPAVNTSQKTPIKNQNIEPKITHLPRRRRSSGGRQSLRSHIPQMYEANYNPEMSTTTTRIVPDVRRLNMSSSSSPKEDSDFHGKSMHSAVTHAASAATANTSKPSLLTSRLWSSSFDQDQNESVSELWTRAGEVYHLLELESQRLASKQAAAAAKAAEAALSATPTTTATNNNLRRYPGAFVDYASHPMTGSSSSSSYAMEKSVPGGSEFSTTQHLPFYSSPVIVAGGANNAKDGLSTKTNNYSSAESSRDHASVNPTAKRLQFRALCSGLRCHRSESNILCDMSGSFLSRQCFCKILAISGSDSKSYAWKPYYMCVADGEVKFIKASWAFYGAGRTTSKTSKHTNDIIYPRNASLNSLRDYSSSSKTHNTSRSQDGLNDDSISYHHPSTSETDCSSISSSNIPGKSISSSSASCLVLPIPGLIWRAEALPANFPNWLPLGSNSNQLSTPTASSSSRPSSTVINNPDWMDPHFSGLSHPPQQTSVENNDSVNIPMTTVTTTTTSVTTDSHYNNTTSSSNNNVNTNEEDIRSKFRCYRFGHIAAGVELLFVFPDENAAMTCLKMCQLSGGRSYDVSKRSERYDHHHHHRNASYPKKSVNPYELVFLKFPAFKAFSEIPVKSNHHHHQQSVNFSMKPTTTTMNRHPVPLAGNECDDGDDGYNESNISNINNNTNKQKNRNHDFGNDNYDDDDDDSAHNRNVFLQPVVVVSSSLMSSPFVTAVGPYCLPKDKRQRRYIINHLPADQELITGRNNTESIFTKNNSVKFNTKYDDDRRKFWTRGRDKSAYYDTRSDTSEATTATTTDPSNYSHSVSSQISELSMNNNNNTTGDEKSHSSNNLIRSNKILRGFKQWLNRPVGGGLNSAVNSSSVSANHTTTTTNNNNNNGISSAIHFSSSTIASGIVNAFNSSSNNNVNGSTNYNHSEIPSTDPLQFSDSPNNEHKLASLTGSGVDPPNLTDMDNPGPIFGAPLESQLESPDYPCVPLLLQAIVIALEIHGLNLPGLYRKPGRHRTISQFISSINLRPDDVNFIFGLDAWREPNALCGLFKHFLRQLPIGLFCLSSWEPLACLIPEASKSSDVQQLAYLLISMRVQLKKIALEAFGIPSMNTMPLDVPYYPTATTTAQTDDTVDCYPLNFNLFGLNSTNNDAYKPSISPPISPHTVAAAASAAAATANIQSKDNPTFTFNNNHHMKMNKFKDFNISKRSFSAWRWATLCYIMNHINRVVAHVQHNAVTYQCIAICFGPVFFGNSTKLPKLNEVLEHLFQHWNWLTDGLPMITKTTVEHIDCGGGDGDGVSTLSYVINNDPTLSDAVTYLTNDNHHPRGQQRQQQDTGNPNDCYHQSRSRESSTHLQAPSSNQNHEQISSELCSNTEKVGGDDDDEDELNREVIKQVKSLWLTALDQVSQANKPLAPKEKAYKYSEVNKSSGLHRTASAIPKTPIGNTAGGRKGGVRRLTVGTASPHPSTFDYYCISPPHFLYTKDNDRKVSTPLTIASTNTTTTTTTAVKGGGGGSGGVTSVPTTTTQCDVIIRRPVVPPVSTTQSTTTSTNTTTTTTTTTTTNTNIL
ncbi:unnamed protein product [Trichobilharzia szidati]|nr:unnamed protein product [Trichobilharzia szidati]